MWTNVSSQKRQKSNEILLICRSCGRKVEPESTEIHDYVISSDLNHVPREKIEVLKQRVRKISRVIDEDRETFEDFFDDDSSVESY
jgi:DNA-directed RNA polymerase subunit M/transcription elongation factor TFIIS